MDASPLLSKCAHAVLLNMGIPRWLPDHWYVRESQSAVAQRGARHTAVPRESLARTTAMRMAVDAASGVRHGHPRMDASPLLSKCAHAVGLTWAAKEGCQTTEMCVHAEVLHAAVRSMGSRGWMPVHR